MKGTKTQHRNHVGPMFHPNHVCTDQWKIVSNSTGLRQGVFSTHVSFVPCLTGHYPNGGYDSQNETVFFLAVRFADDILVICDLRFAILADEIPVCHGAAAHLGHRGCDLTNILQMHKCDRVRQALQPESFVWAATCHPPLFCHLQNFVTGASHGMGSPCTTYILYIPCALSDYTGLKPSFVTPTGALWKLGSYVATLPSEPVDPEDSGMEHQRTTETRGCNFLLFGA